MKINYYRTSEGKFKKKSKWKVLRNWVILIIIVWFGVNIALNAPKSIKNTPESVVTVKDEITPEQREMLKKQAYLAEREVIATNKKNKLDAEYKAESAKLEAELEAIRAEKLSFK